MSGLSDQRLLEAALQRALTEARRTADPFLRRSIEFGIRITAIELAQVLPAANGIAVIGWIKTAWPPPTLKTETREKGD